MVKEINILRRIGRMYLLHKIFFVLGVNTTCDPPASFAAIL